MRLAALCLLAAAMITNSQTKPSPKTHLKVGDLAPDFTLPSSIGKEIKLSDFRGKQNVIVAFFPAAFTGGCTKEVTGYQAGISEIAGANAQVLAISTDNQPTLNHWSQELKLTYPLLSDFMRKVTASYGVLNPERGVANRTTFVVDRDGRIRHIEEGSAAVDTMGAVEACKRLK